MPKDSYPGPLPTLSPAEVQLVPRLHADVEAFATRIGVRSHETHPERLVDADRFVRSRFGELGYDVRVQPYRAEGRTVNNLDVTVPGSDLANEIVIVGAHFDTAEITPGADDNASGMAVLFALAERFRNAHPRRTIRFVAFVNEEPPYFWQSEMGSLVYAKGCRSRHENIVAMLSLECLGYFSDTAGSQQYPPPFNLVYPDRGNFIAFVGNLSSRSLTRHVVDLFRTHAQFPSEGAVLPNWVPGAGWSDHWSFWQVGYDAVMVTDTAPFRNQNYHKVTDTPDTLDFARMARVTTGLERVVTRLANEAR